MWPSTSVKGALKRQREVQLFFDTIEAIFDCLADGVLVVDPNGKILYANTPAHGIFRYACGMLAGRNADDLVPVQLTAHRAAQRGASSPAIGEIALASSGTGLKGRLADGTIVNLFIKVAPLVLADVTLDVVSVRLVDMTHGQAVQAGNHACSGL